MSQDESVNRGSNGKSVHHQEPLGDTLMAATLLIIFYLLDQPLIFLGGALGALFGAYAQQVDLGKRFWQWMRDRL